MGIEKVYDINLYATEGILPDVTVYIDVAPEEGLSRITNSHRKVDRLDLETAAFHTKVREGYLLAVSYTHLNNFVSQRL